MTSGSVCCQLAGDVAEQVAGEVAAVGELDHPGPAPGAGADDVEADLRVRMIEDRGHALMFEGGQDGARRSWRMLRALSAFVRWSPEGRVPSSHIGFQTFGSQSETDPGRAGQGHADDDDGGVRQRGTSGGRRRQRPCRHAAQSRRS